MNLDPTQLADWQIAEAAQEHMKPIEQIATQLGIQSDELIPKGEGIAKIDAQKLWTRIQDRPMGKYIDITAITLPRSEKNHDDTRTGRRFIRTGKSVGAIRQPSGGPTFNIVDRQRWWSLPMYSLAPFALGLTGDIDGSPMPITLHGCVTARMQHEHNYDDE